MTSDERSEVADLHRTLAEVTAYLTLAHEHDAGCSGHDDTWCEFCDTIEYAAALLERTANLAKEVL